MSEAEYVASLRWATERWNEDDYLGGAAIYQVGGNPDWASFETIQIWPVLLDFPEVGQPTNGGDEMTEIYDFEGNQKDEQWLKDVWGVTIQRASPVTGQPYFKLTKIQIDEGPCAILNNVFDANESPMEGVLVAFHWPSAPDPPESGEWPHTTPVYVHDWRPNFVFGATSASGDWGGAMGTGAMVNEGGEGPHWCWIHHPDYPSDCPRGLGWRTGTNHRGPIRLYWKLSEGGGPGPPTNGGDKTLKFKRRWIFDNHSANMFGIAIDPDYATAQDARGEFRGPGIDDLIHPMEWIHPDGTKMALVEGCGNFAGDEPREYTIWVINLQTGKRLTEDRTYDFPPIGAETFARIVDVFELVDVEPPTPEPSDDVTEQIHWHLDQIDHHTGEVRGLIGFGVTDIGEIHVFDKKGNLLGVFVQKTQGVISAIARFFGRT